MDDVRFRRRLIRQVTKCHEDRNVDFYPSIVFFIVSLFLFFAGENYAGSKSSTPKA